MQLMVYREETHAMRLYKPLNLRVNTRVEKAKFSVHKREYEALPETMSVVPLKGDVMFPHVVRQLHLVGKGITKAITDAVSHNEFICVVTMRYDVETPKANDLYEVGTAAKIAEVSEANQDGVKIIVEGVARVKVLELTQTGTVTRRG